MYRIGIIGGGAAGMMAAVSAAEAAPDAQVILFEKNEKLGKKLYITGKGRCNLTNVCETAESFSQIPRNPKFLYSAFYGFDHDAVMSFFEESGVRLKTERGGRVFPVSDHASDITKALENRMRAAGVRIRLNTQVKHVLTEIAAERREDIRALSADSQPDFGAASEERLIGVALSDGSRERLDALIIATGGISYPQTGSIGDGYRFARESGHRVEACRPSLVPMETREEWPRELQGLTLRNVNVRLYADVGRNCPTGDGINASAEGVHKAGSRTSAADSESLSRQTGRRIRVAGKPIDETFGELLFTHFGVSGPVILTLSALPAQAQIDAGLILSIDLKPALDASQLDRRLLRDFEKYANKGMANAMKDLLPQRLIPVVLSESGISAQIKARDLTKVQRLALGQTLKDLHLHVKGLRGYGEAVITRGGVSVKDIDPSTMESKHVSGLYFAGEVIDVDALTGGYNLQIAWSTGHLAGISAAQAADAADIA